MAGAQRWQAAGNSFKLVWRYSGWFSSPLSRLRAQRRTHLQNAADLASVHFVCAPLKAEQKAFEVVLDFLLELVWPFVGAHASASASASTNAREICARLAMKAAAVFRRAGPILQGGAVKGKVAIGRSLVYGRRRGRWFGK